MLTKDQAQCLRAITEAMNNGCHLGAPEASHLADIASAIEYELSDRAKRDEEHAKLQAIGESAARSLAEMVAALNCDYDRLKELRGERDAADYYECGTCGHCHRTGYNADCRNDEERFLTADAEQRGTVFPSEDMEELAELEKAAGECESREDAEQRIQEDPLSLEVRSGWYVPGSGPGAPEEFRILLGTGGPAMRIIGELDEHGEPTKARIESQDWFQPWTEYRGDAISDDDLLTYCRYFSFGEA